MPENITSGDIAAIITAVIAIFGMPWAVIKYIKSQLGKKADKEVVDDIKRALDKKADKEHVKDMFEAIEGKDSLILSMLTDVHNKMDILIKNSMKR